MAESSKSSQNSGHGHHHRDEKCQEYSVYLLFEPERRDTGPEELGLWISTPDRAQRGYVGLLVILTSNRLGRVTCEVREESVPMDVRKARLLGYIRADNVTLMDAHRWWPGEMEFIDRKATLKSIVWNIIDDLEDDGVFFKGKGKHPAR